MILVHVHEDVLRPVTLQNLMYSSVRLKYDVTVINNLL